jgi:DNA-binding NtrC family response regulator
VLLIDDSEASARQLRAAIRADGRQILLCGSVRETLSLLPEVVPDLIICSLDLAELPGLRMLETLAQRAPGVPVLATLTTPSMELGIAAVRAGAEDVLSRPVHPKIAAEAVDRILARALDRRELAQAKEAQRDRHGFSHMLTQSPRMLTVFDQIRAVAHTDATVLILGETGTGKELVSRAIHERSRRRDRPFISVNCGAFTETLLESELFGHEKGSFTGAQGRRQGVFEMADGGTLFLDELGETTLNVQVNLLRVLEEMRFRRVGGHETVEVDVRIIAATNVKLEEAVAAGRFRQDLYYRLNVFPVLLPPLRERREDISLLTRHFLDSAAEEFELAPPTIAPAAMERIGAYRWPGNVRQLRALCERWVILAVGDEVSVEMLPPDMLPAGASGGAAGPWSAPPTLGPGGELEIDERVPMREAIERAVERIERAYLHRLLTKHQGHLSHTADAAGITRRTLYSKMKAFGLDTLPYRSGGEGGPG